MECAQKLQVLHVRLTNLCTLVSMRRNAWKFVQLDSMAAMQKKVVNNVIKHVKHALVEMKIVA